MTTPAPGSPGSLRGRVTQGATLLAAREIAGVGIGFVGVVLLTRIMGPESYGVYAAAMGLLVYLSGLGQWGIRVQLVRRPVEPSPQEFNLAFTFSLLAGLAVMGVGLLLAPAAEAWSRVPGLGSATRVLSVALPWMITLQVHRAILDRRLAFRQVAGIEILGQLAFYAIALPAAALRAGFWAPVAGAWGQQLLSWALFTAVSRYRPRLLWDRTGLSRLALEGMEFSLANWLLLGRSLVNPLVVGRFLGATGVAYVDLAVRIVDNLAFLKPAAARVGIAVLAQMQAETARLHRAVEEGTRWLVLPLGLGLVAFLWTSPLLVPLLFGEGWVPLLTVLPFVAVGSLTSALVSMPTSALYVLRRYLDVAAAHLLHVALFGVTAWFLVPRIGLAGYGFGELAGAAGYALVVARYARQVQAPDLRTTGAWWGAFGAACFTISVGWWMALPLLVLFFTPRFWGEVRTLVREWTGAWRRGVGILRG